VANKLTLGTVPIHRTVDDLKKSLLAPSLTPYFEVQLPVPEFLRGNREEQNIDLRSNYDYLTLLCTEAVLPGNNLITFTADNDYTGVTEKMPHRKVYDQNLQLTFYVNSEVGTVDPRSAKDGSTFINSYYPIKFFESYIAYIAGEDPSNVSSMDSLRNVNYHYQMSYPDEYMIDTGLYIKKFEKGYLEGVAITADDVGSEVDRQLEYEFIRTYPTAINSMPLSYGEPNVLKCTVTYSYIRYIQHQTFITNRKPLLQVNRVPSVENKDPLSPDNVLTRSEERQAIHPNGFANAVAEEDALLRGGKTKSQLRKEWDPNFGKGSRDEIFTEKVDPSTPAGQIENKKRTNSPPKPKIQRDEVITPPEVQTLPLIPPVTPSAQIKNKENSNIAVGKRDINVDDLKRLLPDHPG